MTSETAETGGAESPPLVEAEGITKRFPGVVANADVDLDLHAGEIHCVLGENGAGKTTLMNVVYGLYQPDEGELRVRGERVDFESSADAIAAGIGMVHQHFQLVPVLTVTDNVILGQEPMRGPLVDRESARQRIVELSEQYGLAVDPDARIGDLSVGAQQRVELLKALYREADVLILDEPTAVLTPGEVREFFEVVRGLVAQGKAVVFITHKLREVLELADRISVLRGGALVGTADPHEATIESLAELMVGREVAFTVDKTPAQPTHTMLQVRDLHVKDDRGVQTVQGVDFEVRAGEIFGIAGVEGNGQRELVEAVTGMRTPTNGQIVIGEYDIVGANPRKVQGLGVGHIPEDRGKHGLVSRFDLTENVILNRYHHPPFSQRFLLNRGVAKDTTQRLVEQYDVRTPSIDVSASTLSGGNQQKLVVARELEQELRLLVVNQPTRGLDVGSVEFIHSQLVRRRDDGVAVLLVSAELDEVLGLADRIGVIYRGELLATMDAAEATRERVGPLMAGQTQQAAAAGAGANGDGEGKQGA
ncbi:ABC transporter ATP-binding protein [Egibacter rhizosphaerae]|uniref:ABC transporter ATP-binding protein n=1 Tax=Egibacter rhizosphaerae TaxID=1670831 RepID=A0A411YJ06_9ACTN|nr:ABC transporter ATP-binding protein [Egibacter rhizosphaerae]QBI21177.1 ABC transporter ATP-binding protein [Egibacter rhizosphaerae]